MGEVEGTEFGNVGKKTNVMDLVLRKKIATKMPVSGQLGPSGIVVKEGDFVLKRTDVTEAEKKQIQIVTCRSVNQVGSLKVSEKKLHFLAKGKSCFFRKGGQGY